MRFSAIHKVASYLMVSAAFAALALSRELSPVMVGLTLAGGALSFFAEPARHALLRQRWWGIAWNTVTLVAFSWTILDALRGEALYSGVRFLCFLLVNKLWNRRASRDYLQAYVVSFLMLVAGAALSSDLAYAGCFLAYVVFATWTLTLFHLRREMEENYLLKHSDGAQSERVEVDRILNSRRIVGGSFLAGTSLVSIGIFLGSTVVFFLIPRFGFGFFVSRQRRATATVGFSDRVDLGEYGLVKDNPQVVMRVELPSGQPRMPLRMRGVSFDRYVHGHWSRSMALMPEVLRPYGHVSLLGIERSTRLSDPKVKAMLDQAYVQHVYIDPLDTSVVFGAPRPIAYQLPRNAIGAPSAPRIEFEGRSAGEVMAVEMHVEPGTGRTYSTERKSGLRYTVYSDMREPTVAQLLNLPDAERPADSRELRPFLAVPSDLPPRIGELAKVVTEKHRTAWGKAHALETYLQNTYKYTLDLKRDERFEPLEDFLFVQRAGHCEYFASAMAVMLRTVGIPTRSVNGFFGGEWNSFGNYLAIRHGDAHSWVEVWIEGVGWMTFDPTPPGIAGPTANGVWHRLRQMVDTLELTWFKYFIEYDLNKQVDAVSGVRKWASQFSSIGGSSLLATLVRYKVPLGGGLATAIGLFFLLNRRRMRKAGLHSTRQVAAHHAFERALKALERRGYARALSETGRELAGRVAAGNDPGARPFSTLVDLYYAARFGGVEIPPAELERLAQEVARPPQAI